MYLIAIIFIFVWKYNRLRNIYHLIVLNNLLAAGRFWHLEHKKRNFKIPNFTI